MPLFHLRRKDLPVPYAGTGEIITLIVRATYPLVARKMCELEFGGDWNNPEFTTCDEIAPKGEDRVFAVERQE